MSLSRKRLRSTGPRLGLWLALAVLGAPSATAQFDLSLTVSHHRALRYEPLSAAVTIVYTGNKPVTIGGPDDAFALELDVKRINEKLPQERRVAGPLIQPVTLKQGESRTLSIPMTRHYAFGRVGQYSVRAVLRSSAREIRSNREFVDVGNGFVLEEVNGGRPDDLDAVISYSLRHMVRESGERLFLRADDPKTRRCLWVYDMGLLLRQMAPTMYIDGNGNVNVLHQFSAGRYRHTQISPYGKVRLRDSYRRYGPGRPRLVGDEFGAAVILGAELAINRPAAPAAGNDDEDEYDEEPPKKKRWYKKLRFWK